METSALNIAEHALDGAESAVSALERLIRALKSGNGPAALNPEEHQIGNELGFSSEYRHPDNANMLRLFTALIEFAESRGVSRHPESTLTARLEAAAFGGGK